MCHTESDSLHLERQNPREWLIVYCSESQRSRVHCLLVETDYVPSNWLETCGECDLERRTGQSVLPQSGVFEAMPTIHDYDDEEAPMEHLVGDTPADTPTATPQGLAVTQCDYAHRQYIQRPDIQYQQSFEPVACFSCRLEIESGVKFPPPPPPGLEHEIQHGAGFNIAVKIPFMKAKFDEQRGRDLAARGGR